MGWDGWGVHFHGRHMSSVKVKGAKRLRRELKRAGVDLKVMREPNLAAAKIAAPVAKGKAPVGKTGRLAGSVRPGATRTAGIIRAGGAAVPYAGVQEWGWPRRNIVGKHYLTGGASESEPRWIEVYWRELQRILSNIAGGP